MTARSAGALLALVLAASTPADGAEESAAPPAYSPKGADTCLKCHDESSKVPVVDIFKTPHGQKADPRSPFGQLQCESCHGPGGEHARKKKVDEPQGPILTFGLKAKSPPEVQDGMCLQCHAGQARTHWPGSAHESAGVPCAACHQVHAAHDPMQADATQNETCGTCHARERAAGFGTSRHPLRDR